MSTQTIEDIDVDIDKPLPCEHSMHHLFHIEWQPASYMMNTRCTRCQDNAVYLMCESGLQHLKGCPYLYCPECGGSGRYEDTVISVRKL